MGDGQKRTRTLLSVTIYHRIRQGANAIDGDGDLVAGHQRADPRGRAGQDDVAGEQGHDRADPCDQLRDADALRPWLLRIAANKALGVRRTSSRVVQLHVVPDRPARFTDEDERLTLLACVDRLAPRMRAAVVLRYYADMSVREVAETLGTSENTVKTQLRESLEHMRRALDLGDATWEASHG